MMPSSPDGLRDLALRLSAQGFRVFPVALTTKSDGSTSKRPLLPGYHGAAPFTPEQIAQWQWGRVNALGWAIPPGRVVLDVDVKGGLKAGKEHLQLLEAHFGPLPPTASQRTPSGGWHLVFALPRAVERFHGNVPLPEGGKAAIDICHAGLRFLTLYDEGLFDQDVAVLPEAWVELITKRRSTPMAVAGVGPGASHDELLVNLAQARATTRNITLNTSVFILAKQGRWGEQVEDEARQIAADIGLDSDEIDATIESASTAGLEQRRTAEEWYRSVESDPLVRKRRNWSTLLMVAGHFRDLAAVHGMKTGLSSREMGERLGISHATAARGIKALRKFGYLKQDSLRDKARTTQYRLVVPKRSNCDTHQPSTDSPSTSSDLTGGMSQEVHQLASDLFGHSAFIRMKDTTSFPKSAVFVVAAVHLGHNTVKDIATATGVSTATVRNSLHKLESAGLVDYDSKKTKTVRPFFDDPVEALTKWAVWSGADGNAEVLKQRHQEQRRRRDQALTTDPVRTADWLKGRYRNRWPVS